MSKIELPPLTGTPRQIAWATDIRDDLMSPFCWREIYPKTLISLLTRSYLVLAMDNQYGHKIRSLFKYKIATGNKTQTTIERIVDRCFVFGRYDRVIPECVSAERMAEIQAEITEYILTFDTTSLFDATREDARYWIDLDQSIPVDWYVRVNAWLEMHLVLKRMCEHFEPRLEAEILAVIDVFRTLDRWPQMIAALEDMPVWRTGTVPRRV